MKDKLIESAWVIATLLVAGLIYENVIKHQPQTNYTMNVHHFVHKK